VVNKEKELVLDFENGAYQAQQCKQVTTTVFYHTPNLAGFLPEVLRDFEEEHKCAGICHTNAAGTEVPAPFYLWSNVNNGKPKQSCREPIGEKVVSLIETRLSLFLWLVILILVMQLAIVLTVVIRFYKYIVAKCFCCKRCCKKKSKGAASG